MKKKYKKEAKRISEETQGKPRKVKVVYKDKEVRSYHVHGATGGPVQNFDFRIDFYEEKKRMQVGETLDEKGHKLIFPDDGEDYDHTLVVDRTPVVTVTLSFVAAEQLGNWIISHIENLKKNSERVEFGKSSDEEEVFYR